MPYSINQRLLSAFYAELEKIATSDAEWADLSRRYARTATAAGTIPMMAVARPMTLVFVVPGAHTIGALSAEARKTKILEALAANKRGERVEQAGHIVLPAAGVGTAGGALLGASLAANHVRKLRGRGIHRSALGIIAPVAAQGALGGLAVGTLSGIGARSVERDAMLKAFEQGAKARRKQERKQK